MFDFWLHNGKVYPSTKDMVEKGKAIGIQYLKNYKTHELLIDDNRILVY